MHQGICFHCRQVAATADFDAYCSDACRRAAIVALRLNPPGISWSQRADIAVAKMKEALDESLRQRAKAYAILLAKSNSQKEPT